MPTGKHARYRPTNGGERSGLLAVRRCEIYRRLVGSVWYLLRSPSPDRGTEYCDERVCLSVCMSVRVF